MPTHAETHSGMRGAYIAVMCPRDDAGATLVKVASSNVQIRVRNLSGICQVRRFFDQTLKTNSSCFLGFLISTRIPLAHMDTPSTGPTRPAVARGSSVGDVGVACEKAHDACHQQTTVVVHDIEDEVPLPEPEPEQARAASPPPAVAAVLPAVRAPLRIKWSLVDEPEPHGPDSPCTFCGHLLVISTNARGHKRADGTRCRVCGKVCAFVH